MVKSSVKLIVISRDALLAVTDSKQGSDVFRSLARLTRKGFRILLTAPEPERWVPTRKTVDGALDSQRQLMERARAEGGDIEGVYYVPRSLLTQDRNREGSLQDILSRYSAEPEDTTLISYSAPFLDAANRLKIQAFPVKEGKCDNMLDALDSVYRNSNINI